MGACRIRRGCVAAAVAAASADDPELYTKNGDTLMYLEGSGCSWLSSSPSMGYHSSSLSQLLLPSFPLSLSGTSQTTITDSDMPSPALLSAAGRISQHQRSFLALLFGGTGGRVSLCNAIEFQARATIWMAEQEIERTMRGRHHGSSMAPGALPPLLPPPDAVARWQLAGRGVTSVRKSLQSFLQRRKARIRAARSPYSVSTSPFVPASPSRPTARRCGLGLSSSGSIAQRGRRNELFTDDFNHLDIHPHALSSLLSHKFHSS